jgi:hypothetical protein
MEKEKVYNYFGAKLKLKNLRLAGERKKSWHLIARFEEEMKKSNSNYIKAFMEFLYPENEKGEVITIFKEVFELFLEGNLNKIDYEDVTTCEELAMEVITDFFTRNKYLKRN